METKKRVRSTQFIIRAKPDEANTIRNRVKLSKKETFQAYALEMLLEGKIETYDYSELQKLRIEVNRIGQNVNQLVRYVNTFDEIDNELFKALQTEINDMKKLLFDEFKTKGRAKLNGSDEGVSD
ncbi:plasmid mobilization protein [uncultured Streptococcus sp.]|uniref:plasmid mobilization protein n=1 Tax=uncultured Streptococcus sp. TaxID=83427 RepID=UPI0025972564|nr:plasmid mobilization relaxosome protein MobC [uncultured Streptococcus sp.]